MLPKHWVVEQRTRAFSELQSYYMCADKFERQAKGNDKGKVEGLVGYARFNFMVPIVPQAARATAARTLGDHRRALRARPLCDVAVARNSLQNLREDHRKIKGTSADTF